MCGIIGINIYSADQTKPSQIKEIASCLKTSFDRCSQSIKTLKRCQRCILPETMPFIEFDQHGVCNYCRHYQKVKPKGKAALETLIKPYRSKNGQADCLVAFSGGRDSSYSLHFIKNELKLNPIAYTYDWGMVTDLARRNQARICGKLGIEHILISADIQKKRNNIQKNVLAWLRKPDIGLVPLFMAGDKQFFYYANKVKKQTGIKLMIWASNPFEKTDFKSGFCGVKPTSASKGVYTLSPLRKIKLTSYYLKQFFTNPAYLNASLLDTFTAYLSYYFIPHNYIWLYQYIPWEERKIITTLRRRYNWEMAEDTSATWRIGDGTAAFYNYIYYILTGLTENDTFRSHQIRNGLISRGTALSRVEQENQPRYASIKWYCDIIGLDFKKTLTQIHAAPKRYSLLG